MYNPTAIGSQDLSAIVKKPLQITIGEHTVIDEDWQCLSLANRVQVAMLKLTNQPFSYVPNAKKSPWKVVSFDFEATPAKLTVASV